MKIIYLALDANCKLDSAEKTHVMEVVRELRKHNRVILIAYSLPENRTEDDIEIREIIDASEKNKPGIWLDIRLIFELSRYIIRENIDIIYERRLTPKICALLSLITSRPAFLEVNGDIKKEMKLLSKNIKKQQPIKILIKHSLLKILWKKLSGIVSVTKEIGNSIIEQYKVQKNRVHVIPNAANVDLFTPYLKKQAKINVGLPPDAKVIGFSGQFFPWQGIDILLKAFALVRKRINGVYLLIIGDGELRKELLQLSLSLGISNYVLWLGHQQYEKVPQLLSSCDVAVTLKCGLDSFSPLKLYEYLSLGLPVVATKLPGFEVIGEKKFGILVQEKNIEDAANAIEKLLNNEAEQKRIFIEARTYAVSNCSWAKSVNEIEKIFRKITTK